MTFIGKFLIKGLQSFSYVKGLQNRIHNYEKYISIEPGHFYSPLANAEEFLHQQKTSFYSDKYLPIEINFNEEEQLNLLKGFQEFYNEFPFEKSQIPNVRFSLNNPFFTFSDAIGMYSMIRQFQPKRIIEIGSGFSSALILDTNEKFFSNKIDLTFIDPNPQRLIANLRENEKVNIIAEKIQHTDPSIFNTLNAGDFLLIDTSHVSKSGGDVNHIYFNILPYLKKGVKIHVHDIFFPFEYPEKWVIEERRSWNEIFLLRSFLAYNNAFKIIYFNSFMEKKYSDFFAKNMPLFLERNSSVCGGIWIEKSCSKI